MHKIVRSLRHSKTISELPTSAAQTRTRPSFHQLAAPIPDLHVTTPDDQIVFPLHWLQNGDLRSVHGLSQWQLDRIENSSSCLPHHSPKRRASDGGLIAPRTRRYLGGNITVDIFVRAQHSLHCQRHYHDKKKRLCSADANYDNAGSDGHCFRVSSSVVAMECPELLAHVQTHRNSKGSMHSITLSICPVFAEILLDFMYRGHINNSHVRNVVQKPQMIQQLWSDLGDTIEYTRFRRCLKWHFEQPTHTDEQQEHERKDVSSGSLDMGKRASK